MTGHKNYANLRRISAQGDQDVRGSTNRVADLKSNPQTDCRHLPPIILPAGFDADPAVGVDAHRRAQHHRLGAQVVGHLHAAVHHGQGDVVGALHAFPAPQHKALRGLGADAQLELVHQQGFLTRGGVTEGEGRWLLALLGIAEVKRSACHMSHMNK